MKSFLVLTLTLFTIFPTIAQEKENIYMEGGVFYNENKEPVDTASWKYVRMNIKSVSQQIALDPQNAKNYKRRASLYFDITEYKKAIEDNEKALALDSSLTYIFGNLGNSASMLKDFKLAHQYFDKGLHYMPNSNDMWYNKAICYTREKKWAASITAFDRALEINPKDWQSLFSRASSLQRTGKHQLSIKDNTKVIELNPRFAEAYLNRALSYRDIKEPQKALADLDMVIKLMPLIHTGYFMHGEINFELGNKKTACEYYEVAVELGSKEAKEAYSSKCAK